MDRCDSVADACHGNSLYRRQQLEVVVICDVFIADFSSFFVHYPFHVFFFFLNCGGVGGESFVFFL